MPTVRKLSLDEVVALTTKPQGQRTKAYLELKEMITGFAPGEWGEVQLGEDEKKPTVKNHLKKVASDLGLPIKIRPTREDNLIRFQVLPEQLKLPEQMEEVPA